RHSLILEGTPNREEIARLDGPRRSVLPGPARLARPELFRGARLAECGGGTTMNLRASRRAGGFLHRRQSTSGAARKRTSRALLLEALENRALLSGTPALLKNVNPGTLGSSPGQIVEVGATVFFSADDNVHGREVWKTDGTAAGTALVKDIQPGRGSSYPEYLTD